VTPNIPTVLICESMPIIEGLLETIGTLTTALKRGGRPVAPIRQAGKDADATGAMLGSGERIVHRVAGLSKAAPPLDPFRAGSGRAKRGDDVQRGDPKGFVRREIQHVGPDGFETSIVVTARPHFALFPDKDDAVWRMRIQLDMIKEVVEAARFATTHPGPARAAASLACRVLEAMQGPPIRGAFASCVMPSPLGTGQIRIGGVQKEELDEDGLPMVDPYDWPHAMTLLHRETASSRTWTLTQTIGERRLVDIDPMERLRVMTEGGPLLFEYLEYGEPIR
jgi:hypothetical protein